MINKPHKLVTFLLAIVVLTAAISCIKKRPPKPPMAKIISHETIIHDQTLTDNYNWLRKRDSQEVLDYLKAENKYTEQMTSHTDKFQKILYNEMVARIKLDDQSVPYKDNGYYYYQREEEGKEYVIYCRKRKSLDSKEEIILDENILAENLDFLYVPYTKVSPNGKLLAYSIDTTGREIYTIYFKDLKSGRLLSDVIPSAYDDLVWANDNKTVFYTTLDHALRPYRVYKHTLRTNYQQDELVFEESDEMFWVYLKRSRSDEYIYINLESTVTTETRYLKADKPAQKFTLFQKREQNHEYRVYHHDRYFFVISNSGDAQNFKVMKVDSRATSKDNWVEYIAHDQNVMIDKIDLFKDQMAVYERSGGLKKIRIIKLKDKSSHYIQFPEPVYTCRGSDNYEFDSHKLRYTYYSMTTPKSVFDYDMKEKKTELLKQDEVLGGYDKELYETDRIYAEAFDGTQIPISIVYKKGIKLDGSNPFYLRGYGSYGITTEPYFSSSRLSLLQRGVICGVAHIRGGGVMGRGWYEDGKLLNKKNSFTDFISCAEYIIGQKYTSSDKLIISGGSAGGLLMGAVVNMRPDLFKAVVAGVPFVDVINTMLDASIPLTVTEYEEWGNPNEKEYFDYMKSYSPYDNVRSQYYPNMLITAGMHDPRVQYWEPAKWTAKLRSMKTDDNILLLKTEMGSGHMGVSGRFSYLKETAFKYSFVFDILGIKK